MADYGIGSERNERKRRVAILTKLPHQVCLGRGGKALEKQRVYRVRIAGPFVAHGDVGEARHTLLAFALLLGENLRRRWEGAFRPPDDCTIIAAGKANRCLAGGRAAERRGDNMTHIEGPAGALELAVDVRGGDCAVLCHPHPLYGGSMHDAVLGLAEEAWQRQGGSSIRFNYRGVGASEGSFDGGNGEAEDAVCVANWVRTTLEAKTLTLLGYSFGAGVAWRAAAALDDIAQVVLVAPPMPSMDFPHRGAPRTVLIHGDQDDFVDAEFATKWAAEQESARLITLAGADHFFSGATKALAAAFDTAFGACKGAG